MLSDNKVDLVAVIPVGNLLSNQENILQMVAKAREYFIDIVVILDSQPIEIEESFRKIIDGLSDTGIIVDSGMWRNPGGARNRGLELAKSKWVTFWDSDDLPEPFAIMEMVKLSEASCSDIGIGVFQTKNISGPRGPIVRIENVKQDLFPRIIANPGIWRFIFKREFINGIYFPEYSCAEDQLFIQRVFQRDPQIHISEAICYTYVKGTDGQVTNSSKVVADTLNVIKVGISEHKYNQRLNAALILKQIISILKRGTLKQRFHATGLIFQLGRASGFRTLFHTVILYSTSRAGTIK